MGKGEAMTCGQIFACHSCVSSLKQFIEIGEQALATNRIGEIQIALAELKSAVELARIIAYASENKEV